MPILLVRTQCDFSDDVDSALWREELVSLLATLSTGSSTQAFTAATLNVAAMPTSAVGLSAGDLWNNSGVVNIV